MTRYAFIAASLDGYIADRNNALTWLEQLPNPANSDFGWGEFMRGIDAVILGRKTYDLVATFPAWPYDKPVFVVSTTLRELPEKLSNLNLILDDNSIEEDSFDGLSLERVSSFGGFDKFA